MHQALYQGFCKCSYSNPGTALYGRSCCSFVQMRARGSQRWSDLLLASRLAWIRAGSHTQAVPLRGWARNPSAWASEKEEHRDSQCVMQGLFTDRSSVRLSSSAVLRGDSLSHFPTGELVTCELWIIHDKLLYLQLTFCSLSSELCTSLLLGDCVGLKNKEHFNNSPIKM